MKRIDLRKLRKDHHLTQMQLAEILGCKQNFVSQIEAGKGIQNRSMPADKLTKIKEYFGDISAYISDYEETAEEKELERQQNLVNEVAPYLSGNLVPQSGYVTMPAKFLDELSKLTETIYSQQRTIESLVNTLKQN